MKAEDIRKGDVFLGEGAHYKVIADAETVLGDGAFDSQGQRVPEPVEIIRVQVQFSDGGLDYRHFDVGQDVPLVRPTVRKVH